MSTYAKYADMYRQRLAKSEPRVSQPIPLLKFISNSNFCTNNSHCVSLCAGYRDVAVNIPKVKVAPDDTAEHDERA